MTQSKPDARAHSPAENPVETLPALEAPSSLWADAWHRLLENKAAMAGLSVFVFIVAFSVLGPLFTPYGPTEQERALGASPPLAPIFAFEEAPDKPGEESGRGFTSAVALERTIARLQRQGRLNEAVSIESVLAEIKTTGSATVADRTYTPSGRKHLLGTDNLGRDVLARIMQGGKISLAVGFVAALVALVIGVLYGAAAGYLGGKADAFMMRIVDIMYSLPFTIFVILLMVLFGRSLILLFVVIGMVEWLTMARIVRGQVIHLKTQAFVEVARTYGAGNWRIVSRHLVPNVLGPVIVYTTLLIPAIIMFESFLSFLGLGVQAPNASWGTLIKEGADAMTVHPWRLIFPALFFSTTLLALNFLGDGLRDAFDPKGTR